MQITLSVHRRSLTTRIIIAAVFIIKYTNYNTPAKLAPVLFLILTASKMCPLLKEHVLPAFYIGGSEIIRYIPIDTLIVAPAPAAVFHGCRTAVGYPVAVLAAAADRL